MKCWLKAVQQSLVLESGTSISGLDSEDHKVGQGSGSDASEVASSSFGQLRQPKRMRLRTASVRRRRGTSDSMLWSLRRPPRFRTTTGRRGSDSDASEGTSSSSGSSGSQEDAAEDRLSAQEGGARDVTVAASASTVSSCEMPGGG